MEGINQRQKKIIELVNEKDFVLVKDLADSFNVSLVTIRKDLTFLEEKKHLYRIHGGASKRERYVFEKPVVEKELIQTQEKKEIAKKAASLVKENDFVLLASGTSIYYLAQELKAFNKLTVCTPSLGVSMALSDNQMINVIQLGGELRKSSRSVVGSTTEEYTKQFSSHLLFLGVDGIDLNFGISTSNAAEARLNQVMIEQSDKVVVLADSTKINKRGFGKITGIENIDILITNQPVDEVFLKEVEDLGIEVIIA